MTDTTEPSLLRIPQAAELLNASRSKTYEMAARGEIPVIRLGPRAIRVPRAALEKWIAERTLEAV